MTLAGGLRILRPHPAVRAFYSGRVPGDRYAPGENWVDDGALSLGIATYAILQGDEAVVYDSHVSPDHARAMRAALEAEGVRRFRLVLSHCHRDHVAGNAVFADGEIIANARTLAHLTRDRAGIEAGTRPPAINPLVLPNRVFEHAMTLSLGGAELHLITANIHSDDATLIWWPSEGLLFAGDTVEDCATYVGAPQDFATHLQDLDRLQVLGARAILPNHGAAEVIAAGGYGPELLAATARYIRWLMDLPANPDRATTPLRAVIADDLARGALVWWADYQRVHDQNIARTLAARGVDGGRDA